MRSFGWRPQLATKTAKVNETGFILNHLAMRLLILFEILFLTAAVKESLRKSHEILAQGNNESGDIARKNSSV